MPTMTQKKETIEPPPPITTSTAFSLLVLYTILYVGPFYLSARTRPSAQRPRDAPAVIRARIASVSLSCAAAVLATLAVLVGRGGYSGAQAAHALGCWPVGAAAAARVLLLTATLFLGPLFEVLVAEGYWCEWLRGRPLRAVWCDWVAWRNYVAGPITEEVLFRAAAVPLLVLARAPPAATVVAAPLVFGLAHAHHLYEARLAAPPGAARGAAAALRAALLRAALQLAYTALFGAYATFVLLRTGSLLAAVGAHALCNAMGLPRVAGAVRARRGGGGGGGGSVRAWTAAYYVLLVAGAVGWYKGLWPLTESGNALVPMW